MSICNSATMAEIVADRRSDTWGCTNLHRGTALIEVYELHIRLCEVLHVDDAVRDSGELRHCGKTFWYTTGEVE